MFSVLILAFCTLSLHGCSGGGGGTCNYQLQVQSSTGFDFISGSFSYAGDTGKPCCHAIATAGSSTSNLCPASGPDGLVARACGDLEPETVKSLLNSMALKSFCEGEARCTYRVWAEYPLGYCENRTGYDNGLCKYRIGSFLYKGDAGLKCCVALTKLGIEYYSIPTFCPDGWVGRACGDLLPANLKRLTLPQNSTQLSVCNRSNGTWTMNLSHFSEILDTTIASKEDLGNNTEERIPGATQNMTEMVLL